MKLILLLFWAHLFLMTASSQAQKATEVKLSFFSEAPFENIYAESSKGVSAIDIGSRLVYFKVSIQSFQFEKKLMQEHFNENYLESEKYPYAEFKGKIEEPFDLTAPGVYAVHVSGKLTIHNVTRDYRVAGEIAVRGDRLSATAEFPVSIAEHKVKIPRLLVKNIAEVVLVKVRASYPYSAKLEEETTVSP